MPPSVAVWWSECPTRGNSARIYLGYGGLQVEPLPVWSNVHHDRLVRQIGVFDPKTQGGRWHDRWADLETAVSVEIQVESRDNTSQVRQDGVGVLKRRLAGNRVHIERLFVQLVRRR